MKKAMDFHLNFEQVISLEISEYISKYKGKKLDALFPLNQIICNDMGKFMEIKWEMDFSQNDFNLSLTRNKLLYNLKTVYYIGEYVEQELYKRGIRSLLDLRHVLRYKDSVNEILRLIKRRDHINLIKNKNIYDLDLLFCFKKEDFLFLDIETLDLYDSSIIILGLGYFDQGNFVIRQYFTRDLEEEIAMLEHFKTKILPRFKGFVTYNGKSYDIPFIANRLVYFFGENPMLLDGEDLYDMCNTQYFHLDLYHNCRRKYRGMFDNYSLTNIETQLLDISRKDELPSNLVGLCYRKYKEKPNRYVGLIKKCIEHNYYDIHSMPLILGKLING